MPGATIARLIVTGLPAWAGGPGRGTRFLWRALHALPNEAIDFLVTPGGFLRAPWPSRWSYPTGWSSTLDGLTALLTAAERVVQNEVSPDWRAAAQGRIRYLTVGVDMFAGVASDRDHAELVAVVDVAAGQVVRWTGKSYPTNYQERSLYQVVDLDSHLVELAAERVMVLGCHDLNMFGARGRATQRRDGPRWQRCEAMRAKARAFEPTVVLQHPHTTDTPNIWASAWGSLNALLPSVRQWATGVDYRNPGAEDEYSRQRAPLGRVLSRTRSPAPAALDAVVEVPVPTEVRPAREHELEPGARVMVPNRERGLLFWHRVADPAKHGRPGRRMIRVWNEGNPREPFDLDPDTLLVWAEEDERSAEGGEDA